VKKQYAPSGKRILTPPKGKPLPASSRKTANPPQIILDPGRDYGPAMAKLTDNRKRYVIAYVGTGGRSPKLAAELAGIGGTPENAASEACHLMRNELVLEAIREETEFLFRGAVIRSADTLLSLLDDESAKIRLDAAKELLNRGGMIISQHITVKHEHTLEDLSGDELIARLVELRAKNNLIEYKPTLDVSGQPDNAIAVFNSDMNEVRESEHTENRISGEDAENRILDGDFVELQEAA
jgi:hypothetical protein